MTIEHLGSQSLIGQDGFDDAVVGQVGNLLLVSEGLNGKLDNKSFKEKKRVLLESGYKLPEEIERATSWGPQEIRNRTSAIATEAYNQIWKP